MSKQVEQVVIGSVLGDGSIGERGNYTESHCSRQEDYLRWKRILFDKYFQGSTFRYYGKEKCYHLYVPKQKIFQEYRELCYPNGKKIISNKFIKRIGKLAICIWYFDDGSYNPCFNGVVISSQGFSYEENQKLQKMLKDKFGLNFRIDYRKNGNHHFLACSGKNTDKFLAFIKENAPYIPKSMIYKMGKLHKNNLKWIDEQIEIRKVKRNYYHHKNRKQMRKKMRDYYQNNKEKFKEYEENHKEEIEKRNKIWRGKNKEHISKYNREYHQRYYQKNKDKVKKSCHEYYLKNRERIIESAKKYQKEYRRG